MNRRGILVNEGAVKLKLWPFTCTCLGVPYKCDLKLLILKRYARKVDLAANSHPADVI